MRMRPRLLASVLRGVAGLAVDQALGDAFLDSIRSRSVDTNAAPGGAS